MINLEKLGKTMCFALKHGSSAYGLVMDKEGFVDMNQLIFQLRQRHPEFMVLQPSHLLKVAEERHACSFEIKKNKIRSVS